jgi:hypothetical protein
VIIQSISPIIVQRSEALAGWFTSDRGCGGVDVREALISLDLDPPTIRFSDGESQGEQRLALTLQVTRSDVEVIDVVATARTATVDWMLEIRYTVNGRSDVLRVDNNGTPFRVSGLVNGRAQAYQLLDGKLQRAKWLDPTESGAGMC